MLERKSSEEVGIELGEWCIEENNTNQILTKESRRKNSHGKSLGVSTKYYPRKEYQWKEFIEGMNLGKKVSREEYSGKGQGRTGKHVFSE